MSEPPADFLPLPPLPGMEPVPPGHKAGFIAIVGKPNVGKSTLLNALLGRKLAAVTYKASTTRHRILGIKNEPGYQLVFVDTPGVIRPKYGLHRAMMQSVATALEDADLVMLVVAPHEKHSEEELHQYVRETKAPVVLVVNKMDLSTPEDIQARIAEVQAQVPVADVLVISATHQVNLAGLEQLLLERLPECPPYFPKDQLSDRPERFFVAEAIREAVYLTYGEEIPYSTEVTVEEFTETPERLHLHATIHVARDNQKAILIGKGGKALTKVGTRARKQLEALFECPVFLKLRVTATLKWNDTAGHLKKFGYGEGS